MRMLAHLVWQNHGPAGAQVHILDIHLFLIKRGEIVRGHNAFICGHPQLQKCVAVVGAAIIDVEFAISGNDVEISLGINDGRPSGLPDATVTAVGGGEKNAGHFQSCGIIRKYPAVKWAAVAHRSESDNQLSVCEHETRPLQLWCRIKSDRATARARSSAWKSCGDQDWTAVFFFSGCEIERVQIERAASVGKSLGGDVERVSGGI